MHMRVRLVAALAVIIAMAAPAVAAHADPVNPVTVTVAVPSVATVFPATDGYVDGVTIAGSIDASSPRRVRASVSVVVGTRVLKSWVLSATGPFSFEWNGKAGNTVVAGQATIIVRAAQDDGSSVQASRPLAISAKKITRVTSTKVASVVGDIGYDCRDNTGYTFEDPQWNAWQLKVCPLNFASSVTDSGKRASGTLYIRQFVTMPSAVIHSFGPVHAAVSATFVQYGAGANSMWVCKNVADDCETSSVRTWSGSATVTASSAVDDPDSVGMTELQWVLRVGHGHDLSVTNLRYTVKYTYYALR